MKLKEENSGEKISIIEEVNAKNQGLTEKFI
jgi:hypothetical protein